MLSSCEIFQNISEPLLLQASAGDCSSFEELSDLCRTLECSANVVQAKGIPHVSGSLAADQNQLNLLWVLLPCLDEPPVRTCAKASQLGVSAETPNIIF